MSDILIVINIVLLECILSIDNATALATMVKHLPKEERKKALRYGMIGAYVFRGLAIFIASWIMKFAFIKFLGGLYLLYICYGFFAKQNEESGVHTVNASFWHTIVLVEIMDIAFSIDNIVAVVAMSSNIYLVIFGVFIGILAMRFIAGIFSDLLESYPELEKYAFIVIGMLGLKLCLGLEGSIINTVTSVITISLFSYPFIKKLCIK